MSKETRTIIILDDKDHALKQVIYEFPSVSKSELLFRHFDTLAAFREAGAPEAFAVFLDFFMSKDRDYGSSIIAELRCDHLVCFSSMKAASDKMKSIAGHQSRERIRHVYSVQKLKNEIENHELRSVLERIFGPM